MNTYSPTLDAQLPAVWGAALWQKGLTHRFTNGSAENSEILMLCDWNEFERRDHPRVRLRPGWK